MSLSVPDFLAPAGQLQTAFFPDGDLEANVTVWLAQAATKLSGVAAGFQEAAMTDWVYYRAYSHIAERLASEPDTVTVDDITRSVSKGRIEFFRQQAQQHLENYQSYISTPGSGNKLQSGYVPTAFVF